MRSSETTATAVLKISGLQNEDGEEIVYYRANDEQDEADRSRTIGSAKPRRLHYK